jgi:hypothetical protein
VDRGIGHADPEAGEPGTVSGLEGILLREHAEYEELVRAEVHVSSVDARERDHKLGSIERSSGCRMASGVVTGVGYSWGPRDATLVTMRGNDDVQPETPEAEGLTKPDLTLDEVEGARLFANEVRARLRSDGFTDPEIDGWAELYYTRAEGGTDEGDEDGLMEFIRAEQSSGRGPTSS